MTNISRKHLRKSDKVKRYEEKDHSVMEKVQPFKCFVKKRFDLLTAIKRLGFYNPLQ